MGGLALIKESSAPVGTVLMQFMLDRRLEVLFFMTERHIRESSFAEVVLQQISKLQSSLLGTKGLRLRQRVFSQHWTVVFFVWCGRLSLCLQ